VLLDPKTGTPADVVQRARDPGVKRAYQVVEELMLLANELVASWLSARRSLGVYRVHATPDPEKLERLGVLANKLGVKVDLAQLQDPHGLSRWLARIAEHPRKHVLETLTLRSLKQAMYDIVNVGHFGLASDAYLHFTSPIRRYPDLVVHRLVKGLLRGGKPDTSTAAVEQLRSIATHSSERERAALQVEREVVDLYRAILMLDRVGQEFEGTVSAVVGSGLFVALKEPFVDVMIRLDALGPDHYNLSDDELCVVGARSGETISLGDPVRVVIQDVSILRRQVYGRRSPETVRPRRGGDARRARSQPGVTKPQPPRRRPTARAGKPIKLRKKR
jgi:ribonuclease R